MIAYECTCAAPCSDKLCNTLCPVCEKEGFGACGQKLLSEQTIFAKAEDETLVTISGALPLGAVASVSQVADETARTFVGAETQILYAYDIKIYVGGVEWQPDKAVQVIIAPAEPIQTPVAVTHIAEDKNTGNPIPARVGGGVTTDTGAVAFTADGFSVYLVLF